MTIPGGPAPTVDVIIEIGEAFHLDRLHRAGNAEPRGGDDDARAATFRETALPAPLAFDHAQILADYFRYRRTGTRPPIPAR